MRLIAILLVLAGLLGLVTTAQDAKRPPRTEKQRGISDPALRREAADIAKTIDALKSIDNATLETIDRRIVRLTEALAPRESEWAGRLNKIWGDRLQVRLRRHRAAHQAYLRAESIYRKLGKTWCVGVMKHSAGVALASLARWDEALSVLADAASLFASIDDDARRARAHQSRGDILFRLRRYDDALADWDRAGRLYRKLGNERLYAEILQNRGVLFDARHRYDEALRMYAKAKEIFDRLGNRNGQAGIALNRAGILRVTGRPKKALANLGEAIRLYKILGDDARMGQALENRGLILSDLAKFDEALDHYEQAESCFKKTRHRLGLARVHHNRAVALTKVSRYDEALLELDRSEASYRALQLTGNLAGVFMSRGAVFSHLSRFREALAEYERAAAILNPRNQVEMARLARNRACILFSLGRLEEALRGFDQAQSIYEETGNLLAAAGNAMNRGIVLRSLGRLDDAMANYKKAIALFEKVGNNAGVAAVIQRRGDLLATMGRHREALSDYKTSRAVNQKLGRRTNLGLTAVNEGIALTALGRHEEALVRLDEAEKIFKEMQDRARLVSVTYNRARVHANREQWRAALAQWSEAATRLERTLRLDVQGLAPESSVSLRTRLAGILTGALRCFRCLDRPRPADTAAVYRILQTFHGLGLAEAIADRGQLATRGIGGHLGDRLDTVRSSLWKAHSQYRRLERTSGIPLAEFGRRRTEAVKAIERVESEFDALLERARILRPTYVDVAYPRPATLEELRSHIPKHTALVEYALEDSGCFAFVLTRESTSLLVLGKKNDVIEDLRAVSSWLRQMPPAESIRQPLRRLGRRLVEPVLRALGDDHRIRTLAIAPAGALCRVPVELFLTQDVEAGRPPKSWPFLIRDLDVTYVHSGTVMLAMLGDARRRQGVTKHRIEFAAMGFPLDARTAGTDDVPKEAPYAASRDRGPLPGSMREVIEIATLFAHGREEMDSLEKARSELSADSRTSAVRRLSGKRFTLYLRDAATEKALKTDDVFRAARIVHLACHGEMDPISPRLSRIVLSQSARLRRRTGEDGYLYAREFRNLALDADLLVLSACNTNAGPLSALEGITGLSRAALAGGAGAVLSTLWPVKDDEARRLMVDFYQRWLVQGDSRIRALAQAKRHAITQRMSIRTWAAFTLWDAGDNRIITTEPR